MTPPAAPRSPRASWWIVRSRSNLTVLAALGVVTSMLAGACSGTSDPRVLVVPGWGPSSPGAPSSPTGASSGSGTASSSSGSGAPSGSDGGTSAATGVPCDVATMLASSCTTCHSDPPLPGAMTGLVTYDDLKAPSHADPTKTEAEMSVARMQSASAPMPPSGVAPAANVATLQAWISAGYPTGSCATTGGSSGGGSGGGSGGSSGGGSGGGSSGGASSDLPCDVANLFAGHCTSCHSDPPLASALAGLVTYADLMATAKEDATKTEAQLSLARMQNAASPMPPTGLLAASDVAVLQSWINAGAPKGTCSSDGGVAPPPPPPSVFDGAPPFTAATGQSTHNAGRDCMSCHGSGGGDAPQFSFGGTIYDGNGNAVAGAEVRFVDSTGAAVSVHTSNSGTFYHRGAGFSGPAHVGVRNAAAQMDMLTALQSASQPPASTGGACSACHCTGTGCVQPRIHLP